MVPLERQLYHIESCDGRVLVSDNFVIGDEVFNLKQLVKDVVTSEKRNHEFRQSSRTEGNGMY